jgi:imidazolonepropionase
MAAYTCIDSLVCRIIRQTANGQSADRQGGRIVRTGANDKWDRVWIGANIATMVAGAEPYGKLATHALAVRGERIAWIGSAAEAERAASAQGIPVEDCRGLWLTPGLIDCHTHLVYGGNRVEEFEKRLCGVAYEEIARAGGGIQSTVNATRAADAATLLASAAGRAQRLMSEGVTTIEVKSGYGLDFATERRMLEVARALGRDLAVSIRTTYLGLHAIPAEYRDQRAAFVAEASGPWLAALAAAGLIDAVDAFCENIAFSLAETETFLRAAKALGLRAHVHAGQLSDMGAAELAARYGALSADHLEYLSEHGARALGAAGTVAVLLPGAYFTLRQTTPPPVPMLRGAGVPMAVSTDANPGTSPCTSLLLVLNMACTLFGLTPEEALCGATRHAAQALGLQDEVGTLEVGKRADFALWRIDRPAELCYNLGANPCAGVVYRGERRNS